MKDFRTFVDEWLGANVDLDGIELPVYYTLPALDGETWAIKNESDFADAFVDYLVFARFADDYEHAPDAAFRIDSLFEVFVEDTLSGAISEAVR